MMGSGDFFKRVLILGECEASEIALFRRHLQSMSMAENDILFRQGDTGSRLYIVMDGLVGSYAELPDGGRREVFRFSPGQSFGEMAVISEQPRSTTCYALCDSTLLFMEARDFHVFNEKHPETGVKILKGMIRNMVTWLTDASDFLNSMCIWGEKARLRAITDELTGLYNVRFLDEALKAAVSGARGKRPPFCLLMCDIDDFHAINDAIGEAKADRIIRALSRLLKEAFPGPCVAAKLGGDEFAVLLPATDLDIAFLLAEDLRAGFAAADTGIPDLRRHHPKGATLSIGIAEYPRHGRTPQALKEAADRALFNAKKTGKNRICRANTTKRV